MATTVVGKFVCNVASGQRTSSLHNIRFLEGTAAAGHRGGACCSTQADNGGEQYLRCCPYSLDELFDCLRWTGKWIQKRCSLTASHTHIHIGSALLPLLLFQQHM